jgi:hypothetical protein
MVQQTAVEWLENEFGEVYNKNGIVLFSQVFDIIEQAKQIEKEQIKEAYNMGTWNKDEKYKNSKEYYNKTYNK